MQRISIVIVLIVATLCATTIAGKGCGTEHAPRRSSPGKSIPACGYTICEDPAVRDEYYVTEDSDVYAIDANVIYFGDVENVDWERWNGTLNLFREKYLEYLKIQWNLNITYVGDRYTVLNATDRELHRQIAAEYFQENKFLLMFSMLDPNPKSLLGYAVFPDDVDFDNAPELYYSMNDIIGVELVSITTLIHEVGHMFGLRHPFGGCDECSETLETLDNNIVGDFCNDTQPSNEIYKCDATDVGTDCNDATLPTDPSMLPLDNYMAYTDDECQYRFTPQQVARARCYLDIFLSRFATLVETPPVAAPATTAPQATAPQATAPQSGTAPSANAPSQAPVKPTSGAARLEFAAALLLTAALF